LDKNVGEKFKFSSKNRNLRQKIENLGENFLKNRYLGEKLKFPEKIDFLEKFKLSTKNRNFGK